MTEHLGRHIELDVDSELRVVAFSADGQHLVTGQRDVVGVWREELVAAMPAISVQCLAVSPNGRWIAAGSWIGHVYVWNAATHEQVLKHGVDDRTVHGVDFSPDSTHLVIASESGTATVWDIAHERKQTLFHDRPVWAAKYSPHGDRIATATQDGVRVWCSNDATSLVIPVRVAPCYNTCLSWFDRHLFVISDGAIRELDASTGSTVSKWSVLDTDFYPCIALPKHGEFVAYSTRHTLSLWDRPTHSRISHMEHHEDIRSFAISPDDNSIAICGQDGKIIVEILPRITNTPQLDPLHRVLQEPVISVPAAVLDAWKNDQLEHAETLSTTAIATSLFPNYHVLACRALIRARLQKCAPSLADAETAIEIKRSAVAYIAKSLAHVADGERHKAYRACDIAFEHLDSSHVTFLLLIKAVIVFMAGEHVDAISRMDDLIHTVPSVSECCVVQAYMHLLIGKSRMESCDYEGAIESFEKARANIRPLPSGSLCLVSMISGWKFGNLDFTTRQCLCEALYSAGRFVDAVEIFHKLTREVGEEISLQYDDLEWTRDFSRRSFAKLEDLGDTAAEVKRLNVAITLYSTALSLDPPSPQDVLIKRSKSYLAIGSLQQALDDANQVVGLDPSSPFGYEMKHAALHMAGDHENAIAVFEEMLSKIEQSPNPEVQRLGDLYVRPSSTRATIRKLVQKTTRHLPRELINTSDGRLYNRKELGTAFQSSPIFHELVSSMTTRIDYVWIKREVRLYFRYVMLSHRWEDDEPLFQQVKHISVYDLDPSATHDKLQTFCRVVRDAGFNWAWSDTCCINQSNHFVLQEALVAMFKWYEGSALTIVYLRGVLSSAQLGSLVRSIWNTRSWTLQEYIAAKVVLFYTEEWNPYLDLQLENHKESPEVISEMEEVTGVPAEELMALRPGLANIRDKLRLASSRNTTLVEDEAYSLLGIFSASGISAIYGEGENALGRLLANVITRSGDVSVLAWTGESGPFNTCLPAHLSVFDGPVTSHLPARLSDAEMNTAVVASRVSFFDLDTALRLYIRLRELPTPRFAESRMTLPCMTFRLSRVSLCGTVGALRTYRTTTDPFGVVEVSTKYDLTRFGVLYLVHPWLGSLLEYEDAHSGAFEEDNVMPPPSPTPDDEDIDGEAIGDVELDDPSSLPGPPSPSPPSPIQATLIDRETRARRLVARLRQPFGALLFRLTAADQRIQGYKRIAADSTITVQFRADFPLAQILDRVRTVDVL